jgi:hypothetical protein
MVGNSSPLIGLLQPKTNPLGDARRIIASRCHALSLHLGRRGQEQDEDGIGIASLDLAGALHLDLEEEILALGRMGPGRPVLVAGERGVLEKSVGFQLLGKGIVIDEDVRVLPL